MPLSDAIYLQTEDNLPDLPDSDLKPGILPTEIRKLVESRREVKKLMKQPDLSQELKLQVKLGFFPLPQMKSLRYFAI